MGGIVILLLTLDVHSIWGTVSDRPEVTSVSGQYTPNVHLRSSAIGTNEVLEEGPSYRPAPEIEVDKLKSVTTVATK